MFLKRRAHEWIFASVCIVGVTGFYFQARSAPGKQENGAFLVTTGQALTPAGHWVTFDYQRPKDVALSPDGQCVAVLAHRRLIVVRPDGSELAQAPLTAGPLGVAFSPDGKRIYASASAAKLMEFSLEEGKLKREGEIIVDANLEGQPKPKGDPQLAGVQVSPDGKLAYVAMTVRNAVATVDLAARKVVRVTPTGVAPFHLALSPDASVLAVSNRGGRQVRPAEAQIDPNTGRPFEGTGVPTAESAGTPVQIDPSTDAAWRGSVSLVDTSDYDVREVGVGRQPSGLCFDGAGKRLFVAESDSDSVSWIDVPSARVTGNLSVRPPQDPQFGQIPTDVAISRDQRRLFVTLGGTNAVAVVELKDNPTISGYVPTGWFPIALHLTGDRLLVASSKGIGARPSDKQTGFGVHDSVGMFQSIELSQLGDLRKFTASVAKNNLWNESLSARARRPEVPVPQRLGEPSVFKHVVYIIKENLTYDSTMGDMTEGNGDPSLCTFGEEVSPNHHALAREFVLLDNFYTSGTNSADGHQWTSSSVANGYTEQNYASNVRSYPYDGGDPLAYSPQGFLWTAASRAKRSVRVFGEFVNKPKIVNPATGKSPTFLEAWQDYKTGKNSMIVEAHTDNAALRPFLHPNYIGFPTVISDQWRADQFLAEFREWEAKGNMPDLTMMLLPCDHTSGTSEGMPTPRASVADNDLALGRIVEAISRSKFWKDTLILVLQDDSQLGVDHVDGHRSIAFCISPYTKRKAVISDMYNHTSFVRTIGLVLGIPPMNRFDRTGTPLTNCFVSKPDLTPYTAKPNRVPLDEMNPSAKKLKGIQRELALECDKLDWSGVDRAKAETVAKAVWYSANPNRPFPSRYYRPPADQDDDD